MPNIYCDGGTSSGGISRVYISPGSISLHNYSSGRKRPASFSISELSSPRISQYNYSSIIINGIIGLVLLGVAILTIASVLGFI